MEVGQKAEPEEKVEIPKMTDMNFSGIAEGVYESIGYRGKDDLKTMDDDDIRTYIEDFAPEEYSYELGTGKLQDEFIERTLKEFKKNYMK